MSFFVTFSIFYSPHYYPPQRHPQAEGIRCNECKFYQITTTATSTRTGKEARIGHQRALVPIVPTHKPGQLPRGYNRHYHRIIIRPSPSFTVDEQRCVQMRGMALGEKKKAAMELYLTRVHVI